MIILATKRQYAEYANVQMFNYINLYKITQLKNVEGADKTSTEYLAARLIVSLLDEVELLLKKKLINTTKKNISIKMSDAAGIALYKMLLRLPVAADEWYFNHVRNAWIEALDRQIIK